MHRTPIVLLALLGLAPRPARADSVGRIGASASLGYSDNAHADFDSSDPFGPTLAPGFFAGLAASLGMDTTRADFRGASALDLELSHFVGDVSGMRTRDIAGSYAFRYTPAAWEVSGRIRLQWLDVSAFAPEDIVGPVPLGGGESGKAAAELRLAHDFSVHLRAFNEIRGTAQLVATAGLVAGDDLGLQLTFGLEMLELRVTGAIGRYDSGISDGPYADDRIVGGAASWEHDLGAGWATLASAGAVATRRDNTHYDFAMNPGVFTSLEPTARARIERRAAEGMFFVEAARRVTLNPFNHDTYVVSEAIAHVSQPISGQVTISAEGGVARFDDIGEEDRNVVSARGAAGLDVRLSKVFGLHLQFESLYQDGTRVMHRNLFLVAFEAGDPPPPNAAR